MKKTISVLGALMFAVGLTACNTMSGLGQDIGAGGKKIEKTADQQQQEMKRN